MAERKDVLCAFFGLLSLWEWTTYVGRSQVQSPKSKVAYGAALLFFILGLMSKPMLVSLPIIMLLLDFWPLERMSLPWATRPAADGPVRRLPVTALLLEKLPFLAVTLVMCCVTFKVQHVGGAITLTHLTLLDRIANALNSYVGYLGRIFWPVNLAVLYPYPAHIPAAKVIAAAVVLATVTFSVLVLARTRPHLVVGWFWFVVMLVPAIGLVQVGEQAMADRYSYLPSIGIAMLIAWGIAALGGGRT